MKSIFFDAWTAYVEQVKANWEAVSGALSAAWEAIKTAFSAGWAFLQEVFFAVWNAAVTGMQAVWDTVTGELSAAWETVKAAFSDGWGFLQEVFFSVWNAAVNGVRAAWDAVSNGLRAAWEMVKAAFSSAWNFIQAVVFNPFKAAIGVVKAVFSGNTEAMKSAFNTFKTAIHNAIQAIKDRLNTMIDGFKQIPGKIKGAFAGAGQWLLDAGRSIISGLANGIRNAGSAIMDAIRAVIPDAVERFVPGLHFGGLAGFARGGVLPAIPGISNSQRDPILGWSTEKKQPIARVEPGEFVVNRAATKRFLPLLAAINGGKLNSRKGDLGLPGYANGGLVGYADVIRFLKGGTVNGNPAPGPLEGSPYVWGGGLDSNWGDWSGFQSAVAAGAAQAASDALAAGKVTSTSTSGVTVDTGSKLEQIDWGTASNLASEFDKDREKRSALRRWTAGIFDTGGILPPGGIAINKGKPERVLTPGLTKSFDKFVSLVPGLSKSLEKFADTLDGKVAFAGAVGRDMQSGRSIGAYLSGMSMSEGLGLADRVGKLIGVDGIKSTFGGVVDGFTDLEDAAVAQVDAQDALKQAQAGLAKAQADGKTSAEDLKNAQTEVTKAQGAVKLAAEAMGQSQVAMALEIAELVVSLVDWVNARIQSMFTVQADVWNEVSKAVASVGKLADMVATLREQVSGFALDQVMAQIELQAAARNVRIAQLDQTRAHLEGVRSVAEAQAAFDAQRRADMRLAAADYTDLSLAFDRFRWNLGAGLGESLNEMAAWSDESHALYSELLAAQTAQKLLEANAQKASLVATFKHAQAALALTEVTNKLNVAAQKLAVASGQSFGMDQIGATVGQRYAELMAEKVKLEGENWDIQNWLLPWNWGTYGDRNARIGQINEQLAQLERMPEFDQFRDAARQSQGIITQAQASTFFGSIFGQKVNAAELVNNSALGNANRALQEVEFQNQLIDLRNQQKQWELDAKKATAEIDQRLKLDPLETLISALELEQDSNKAWAEYWRTDNEAVRKAIADLAQQQADSASELKRLAEEPAKVVNLYGATANLDDVQRMLEELGVKVNRLENPTAGATAVVRTRVGI